MDASPFLPAHLYAHALLCCESACVCVWGGGGGCMLECGGVTSYTTVLPLCPISWGSRPGYRISTSFMK